MNETILPLVLSAVALVFAGGWYISVADNRRLRAKNENLNDSLLSAIGELAQVKERARNLEDARAAMSEHFKAASFQAMEQTAEGLLKRAEESFVAREKLALERMDSSLKPVAETLGRFEAQVKEMEENRHKDTGGLKQQIEHLMTASTATRDVTAKLANALRRGAGVQGRWGRKPCAMCCRRRV